MGLIAPPSGCNDVVGAAPPPGGSNVTSISYNTNTQVLTVTTDQPASYTTTIPLSTVVDNGNGTFTFDNQVDPPVTWNASGLVQTVTGYWVDNTDPLNPIILTPKFHIDTVPPTVNDDTTQDYSVNSFWYQSNLKTLWVCQNASAGTAVWQPVVNANITNVAPTVNDDGLDGYFPGYIWFNTVTNLVYLCVTSGSGTALWFNINPPGGISITATDPIIVTPSPITGIGVISSNIKTDTTMTGNGSTASPLHVLGSSLDFAIRVRAATTAALPNAPVYNNGVAGVGATLTRTGNGALPNQDGVALQVNDLLLVKNQAAQLQNGVYSVTQLGGAGTPWILTRPTSSDQTAELDNQVVIVSEGTTQGSQIFAQQTQNPIIGTDPIVYTLQTGVYVTQQTTGTQANRRIPWWTGTARQLARGIAAFTFDASNRLNVGTARINSADGDIELIKNITYDWPALQSVGIKMLTNDGAGNLSWSTAPYTNEDAQDAVGNILTDTDTIDFTYNDVANQITAAVRFQMSITSDVNGIKLVNDLTSPGNLQYYGTSAIGVRGWFSLTEQVQDAIGAALTDTDTVDLTYNDIANQITADVISQNSITSAVAGGIQLVNDVLAPGNSFYYGTDAAGVKGFFVIPGGGTVMSVNSGENVNVDNTNPANPIINACTEDIQFTGEISPPAFGVKQNNYNPAGLSTASVIYLTSTNSAWGIGGIVGGTAGRILILHNTEGLFMPVYNNDPGSLAINQLQLPNFTDYSMAPYESIVIQYDINFQKWRMIGAPNYVNTGVLTVNDDGLGVIVVDNTDPQNPIVTYQGTQGMISLTWAAMMTLVSGNLVKPGQEYLITDPTAGNLIPWAGILGVVIQGQTVNKVSLQGKAGFLIADYSGSGDYSGVPGFSGWQSVWKAVNEVGYVNGTVVTWDNLNYVVINSGAFAGTSPNVNPTAYQPLSITPTTGYIEEWDVAEYDLVNDWVQRRQDKRGNIFELSYPWAVANVSGNNLAIYFQWGNNNVYGNHAKDSYFTCMNNYGILDGNRVWNSANIQLVSNLGGLYSNIFENGANATVDRNAGLNMSNCRISGGPSPVPVFDPAVNYQNEILEKDKNTFETTIDVTAIGFLDLSAFPYASSAGVIRLTSSNPTETIDHVKSNTDFWPIKFITETVGLAITWKHTAAGTMSGDDIALENNTDVNCTAYTDVKDFIVLGREGSFNRQITGSVI